jgi:hypothetical protein
VNRKRKLSAVFLQPIQNPLYMSHVLQLCISFLRVFGCTLFTCDMYICGLRHINDSVLSSLKMEGIRLLFYFYFFIWSLSRLLCCVGSGLNVAEALVCFNGSSHERPVECRV